MVAYTKDYNYTDVDTAVTEYPTQTRSTRSRVRVKEMSVVTAQTILDYIDNPDRIPHSVMKGSKTTIEVTFLSDKLTPTLITIVGTDTNWKLRENLKNRIAQVI